MSELYVKNISKSFKGEQVLNSISFSIADGELVSLLGESGAGKSTMLKIIAGLMEPDSGDIILNGNSIMKLPPEKRKTVIVFQEHLLFPHLNVEDNIGFGLKMSGVSRDSRHLKVMEIISMLRLQGLETRFPKELSGGQRQRVALGRALAVEPRVLLLDEPFSSLDIKLRQGMRELVLDIQKKLGITTILVTHDKEEALMMSDKIGVMVNGCIAQFDTPENIYEKPADIRVSDFFGEKNYFQGSLEKGIFKCELGEFDTGTSFKGSGKIMIKPEDIMILHQGEGGIPGKITSRRYLGDKVNYVVEVNGMELKVSSSGHMRLNTGDAVNLCIDFTKGIFYSSK